MARGAVPRELWTEVFLYAFDVRHLNIPMLSFLTLDTKTHAAWEQAFLSVADGGKALEDGARLMLNVSRQLHKRILLALYRSPPELRSCVTNFGDDFLAGCRIHGPGSPLVDLTTLLAAFPNLVNIGRNFCKKLDEAPVPVSDQRAKGEKKGNKRNNKAKTTVKGGEKETASASELTPARYDLHLENSSITAIGAHFLCGAKCGKVQLPPSLRKLGPSAFSGCEMLTMDLRGTKITSLGENFFRNGKFLRLYFPDALKTVGNRFLSEATVIADLPDYLLDGDIPPELDFSNCALKELPDHFLEKITAPRWTIRFPRSLKKTGLMTLLRSVADVIDLSQCESLEGLGDLFMVDAKVEHVLLPKGRSFSFGPNAFLRASLTSLDLSETALTAIPRNFGTESFLQTIRFPPSLLTIADDALCRLQFLTILDLSTANQLTAIGNQFCTHSVLEKVVLPPTVTALGHQAFLSCTSKALDLSECFFTTVGNFFLADCTITDAVTLPATLVSVGQTALARCKIGKLLLENTSLQSTGPEFLGQSVIGTLNFPTTFASCGLGALARLKTEADLDFSDTSLTSLPDFFLADSVIKGVKPFPPTLKTIGAKVFTRSNVVTVDLGPTAVTSIDDNFCAECTNLREVIFPDTLTELIGENAFVRMKGTSLTLRCSSEGAPNTEQPSGVEGDGGMSGPKLKRVGKFFMADTVMTEGIVLPSSLEKTESLALARVQASSLNLASTRLRCVDEHFLAESKIQELQFPACLKICGSCFVAKSLTRKVDLAHTAIDYLPEFFFADSQLEEITLPSCLKGIARCGFVRSHIKRLLLAHTALTFISEEFCSESDLEEITLPPTLRSFGNTCFVRLRSKKLDVHQSQILTIGDFFAADSEVEEVVLPSTLCAVGNCFLIRTHITSLDLTHTQIATIGTECAAQSDAEAIAFPSSIRVVGDNLCLINRVPLKKLTLRAPSSVESDLAPAMQRAIAGIRSRFPPLVVEIVEEKQE